MLDGKIDFLHPEFASESNLEPNGAAYQGLDAVIEFLVGRGAKMDVMDEFGQTPLSIAYAVVTEGLGDKREQSPRVLRKSTSDLLLKLGATPLAASGVKRVSERSYRVEESNINQ